MAIHFWSHAKASRYGSGQISQMGRNQCTSLVNDPHEHHPECASWLGLLFSQSSLGQSNQPLCASRSHRTESSSNSTMHEALCRRRYRNVTCTHIRTAEVERGMRWTRNACLRCTIHQSHYLVNANTLLGSCSRNPRRSPRSKGGHLTSQHRVE